MIIKAKEKRGIVWEGCRISVFPDMLKELPQKRKAFSPVMHKLRELNVRFNWLSLQHFRCKGTAEKFVNEHEQEGAVG